MAKVVDWLLGLDVAVAIALVGFAIIAGMWVLGKILEVVFPPSEADHVRGEADRLANFVLDVGLFASFEVDVQLFDDHLKREARFFAAHGLIKAQNNKLSLTPEGLELFAVLAEGPNKERLTEMAAILAMGEKAQKNGNPIAAQEFVGRVQRFIEGRSQEGARPSPSRSRGSWRTVWW